MAEDPKCPYTPPAGAEPETRIDEAGTSITWTPEAHDRLERVPAFLRTMARKRLEAYAREQGVAVITPAFMQAHRPKDITRPPFSHRGSP